MEARRHHTDATLYLKMTKGGFSDIMHSAENLCINFRLFLNLLIINRISK